MTGCDLFSIFQVGLLHFPVIVFFAIRHFHGNSAPSAILMMPY